jgi:hypothetical protein
MYHDQNLTIGLNYQPRLTQRKFGPPNKLDFTKISTNCILVKYVPNSFEITSFF